MNSCLCPREASLGTRLIPHCSGREQCRPASCAAGSPYSEEVWVDRQDSLYSDGTEPSNHSICFFVAFEMLSEDPSGFIRKKEVGSHPSQLSRSDGQQSQAFFFFFKLPLASGLKILLVAPTRSLPKLTGPFWEALNPTCTML